MQDQPCRYQSDTTLGTPFRQSVAAGPLAFFSNALLEVGGRSEAVHSTGLDKAKNSDIWSGSLGVWRRIIPGFTSISRRAQWSNSDILAHTRRQEGLSICQMDQTLVSPRYAEQRYSQSNWSFPLSKHLIIEQRRWMIRDCKVGACPMGCDVREPPLTSKCRPGIASASDMDARTSAPRS